MEWTFEQQQRTEKVVMEYAVEIMEDLGIENSGASLDIHYAPYVDKNEAGFTAGYFRTRKYVSGREELSIAIAVERQAELVIDTLAHEFRHMQQHVLGIKENHLHLRVLRQRELDKVENGTFAAFKKDLIQKARYYNYASSFEEVDARVYGAWFSKQGSGRGPRTLMMDELQNRYPNAGILELERIRYDAAELYCLTLEYNNFIIEKGE